MLYFSLLLLQRELLSSFVSSSSRVEPSLYNIMWIVSIPCSFLVLFPTFKDSNNFLLSYVKIHYNSFPKCFLISLKYYFFYFTLKKKNYSSNLLNKLSLSPSFFFLFLVARTTYEHFPNFLLPSIFFFRISPSKHHFLSPSSKMQETQSHFLFHFFTGLGQ
jgi:hypothetical protein